MQNLKNLLIIIEIYSMEIIKIIDNSQLYFSAL